MTCRNAESAVAGSTRRSRVSGWCCRSKDRYAEVTSAAVASGASPSTSYGSGGVPVMTISVPSACQVRDRPCGPGRRSDRDHRALGMGPGSGGHGGERCRGLVPVCLERTLRQGLPDRLGDRSHRRPGGLACPRWRGGLGGVGHSAATMASKAACSSWWSAHTMSANSATISCSVARWAPRQSATVAAPALPVRMGTAVPGCVRR